MSGFLIPRYKKARGSVQYTTSFSTPFTTTFTVPAGVNFISVVAVGGGGGGGSAAIYTPTATYLGGGGGGGGALAYNNNIPVYPGESLTVVVGEGGASGTQLSTTVWPAVNPNNGGNGGDSYIYRTTSTEVIVRAGGGRGGRGGLADSITGYTPGQPSSVSTGSGGQIIVGIGGGAGGAGGANAIHPGTTNYIMSGAGGGGAGGYNGPGGNGSINASAIGTASNPSGGAGSAAGVASGGGGGGPNYPTAVIINQSSSKGGGVGLFGRGIDGAASIATAATFDGYSGSIPFTESFAATQITSIALNLPAVTSLTLLVNGSADDTFVAVALPWAVIYAGVSYTTVYVGSNSYLTFGSGASQFTPLNAGAPGFPKIMIDSSDNSYQRVYAGVQSGTTPNRVYRVRYEGTAGTSGTVGSPNMVWEAWFYENQPSRIDIQIGVNARNGAGFSGICTASALVEAFPSVAPNRAYQLLPAGNANGAILAPSNIRFGGGGSGSSYFGAIGGPGAVRIVWPGDTRLFSDYDVVSDIDPTYSISPASTVINEGSTVAVTVTTTNVADGTVLYYALIPQVGPITGTTTGSITINSNTASFNTATLNVFGLDSFTEGDVIFTVILYTDITRLNPVAASPSITVLDSSRPPIVYPLIASSTVMNEADSVTFAVNTENFPTGKKLYWAIDTTVGVSPVASTDFSQMVGSFTMVNNVGSFSISSAEDLLTEGPENFIVNVATGISAYSPAYVFLACSSASATSESSGQTLTIAGSGVTAFSLGSLFAVQFGGAGYLSSTVQIPFTDQDFTIEAWINPSTSGTLRGIVQNWNGGGEFGLEITTANVLRFFYTNAASGISTIIVVGTTVIPTNTYTHVAVVRNGGDLRLYVNGVADIILGTINSVYNIGSDILYYYNGATKNLVIGIGADLTGYFTGAISQLRIVNGKAMYTGTSFSLNTTVTGQQAYTTPGTYTWVAPAGVTSVSAVCVGAGGGGFRDGGGGGGGGLAWVNNIAVVPGQSYTVVVGAGGTAGQAAAVTAGGDSYFIGTNILRGGGGAAGVNTSGVLGGAGGTFFVTGTAVSQGGGNGGSGGAFNVSSTTFLGGAGQTGASGGGGGAGGYAGAGGNGGAADFGPGGLGAGGGGGGGGTTNQVYGNGNGQPSGGAGGGVGIFGQGANGNGGVGVSSYASAGGGGGGGSGGGGGQGGTANFTGGNVGGMPGLYGGGGGGSTGSGNSGGYTRGDGNNVGGGGAVRIIWGPGRAYPATLTVDQPFFSALSYSISTDRTVTSSPVMTLVDTSVTLGKRDISSMSLYTTWTPISGGGIQGQVAFTTTGTYLWTAPAGVGNVHVVAVGAGGIQDSSQTAPTGAGGGGLGWKNNIPVIPGQSYTVVVGRGSIGFVGIGDGDSYFISRDIVKGGGGSGLFLSGTIGNGGSYTGDGGGNGGRGGISSGAPTAGGGGNGGAGGYNGNGGLGGTDRGTPGTGSGGGGGGGGAGGVGYVGWNGGGVGIFGLGTSGLPGVYGNPGVGASGGAGSGGTGVLYGAGFPVTASSIKPQGAVRIIWGAGRAFPSTLTTDQSNTSFTYFSPYYLNPSANPRITGVAWKPDGTIVYISMITRTGLGSLASSIYSFPVTTAWNIATAIAPTGSLVNFSAGLNTAIMFNPTGTAVYFLANQGAAKMIQQFPLPTAWNISSMGTGTNTPGDYVPNTASLDGMCFGNNGTYIYVTSTANNLGYLGRVTLPTPYNISSITSLIGTQPYINLPQATNPTGITFSNEGLYMYITDGTTDKIYVYLLSIAWDHTSAAYTGVSYDLRRLGDNVTSMVSSGYLRPGGNDFYVVDGYNSKIAQFKLSN